MSAFRSATCYVKQRTMSRLRLAANLYPSQITNTDEMADELINEGIERRWPEVLAVEKQIEEVKHRALQNIAAESVEGSGVPTQSTTVD